MTADQVSDPDSFGRNVKWLALLSAFFSLREDCTPPPGAPQQTRSVVFPVYRVESDVLNDPALIDPETGVPLGGVIEPPLSAISVREALNKSRKDLFRASFNN